MDIQILIGLLLTILPIFELRGGLPIIIEYLVKNNLSIWPYFLLVLVLNISIIFLIFMFLDFLHERFMGLKWYKKAIGKILNKIQKKANKVKIKMNKWGYLALMLFVAIPLPGSGVWTGTLVAWIIGLNRLKSFFAISAGAIIAGLLVLLLSLGIFSGFC
jgi:uncharacterized membrane protein